MHSYINFEVDFLDKLNSNVIRHSMLTAYRVSVCPP